MAGRRILIYSSQEVVRDSLLEQMKLCQDISSIDISSNYSESEQKVKDNFFDAIIVDEDIDLILDLRKAGFLRPIILISSSTDIEKFSNNIYINDVISKPFKISSFLSRFYKSICLFDSSDTKGFAIGNFLFQPLTKSIIYSEGKEVKLTEKEAEILSFLYHAKGKLVDREKLLSEVWGYNAGVTTHTLETHMYRLRQKLDTGNEEPLIITEIGGYRISDKFLNN